MSGFEMDLDELQRRVADKRARIDANVAALEEAYLQHEDFIADFDKALEQYASDLVSEGLVAFQGLRDRAYEMLLGPLSGATT